MSTSLSWISSLWCKETFQESPVEYAFQYVDLTLCSDGAIQMKQGNLTANQVEDWVREAGEFKRPYEDKGGLRLLVGSTMNKYRHNLKPWCFSRATASLLFEEFDLMDTFFHACKTGNRVMSFRSPQPGSRRKPSWMLRQTHHAAAISYCIHTNRVCGVVLAGSIKDEDLDKAQDDFIKKVLELKAYACHPMLLPYVVLSKEADRLNTQRDVNNTLVLDFEGKTGLRNNSYTDEEFTNEMTKAMREIVDCLVMITNYKADTEILEKNFKGAVPQSIQIFEEAIQRKQQSQDEDADDEEALVLRDSSIMDRMQLHSHDLGCRFRYLFDCNTSTAASFEALQKRAEVQMEGLFMIYTHRNSELTQQSNSLNLQIAKDSRRLASASQRDSSSMKIIAVITTLFIPATFIATVFGMPTVNLRFWVYLAISIPLTLLVMVLVSAWMLLINNRNRVADN